MNIFMAERLSLLDCVQQPCAKNNPVQSRQKIPSHALKRRETIIGQMNAVGRRGRVLLPVISSHHCPAFVPSPLSLPLAFPGFEGALPLASREAIRAAYRRNVGWPSETTPDE
mgnify:CR=1 FL=1